MFGSDWLKHPAIGVALFALIALGLTGLGKEYQIVPRSSDQPASYQLDGAEGIRLSFKTPNADPEPDRSEWREEKDLEAQRQMALWAFAMFFVTGVGVFLVARTLSATRETVTQMQETNKAAWKAVETNERVGNRQIEIAEHSALEQSEIARTSQASLVVVKEVSTEINKQIRGEAVRLEYQNIGKSAAFNIRFSGDVEIGGMRNIIYSPYIGKPNTWNNFLYSEDSKSCWFGFDRERLLAEYKGPPPDHDHYYFFFSGVILWRDVFHKWRGSRFNYYTGFALTGPFNSFIPGMTGNEVLQDWQIKLLLEPHYKPQTVLFRDRPDFKNK